MIAEAMFSCLSIFAKPGLETTFPQQYFLTFCAMSNSKQIFVFVSLLRKFCFQASWLFYCSLCYSLYSNVLPRTDDQVSLDNFLDEFIRSCVRRMSSFSDTFYAPGLFKYVKNFMLIFVPIKLKTTETAAISHSKINDI